MTLYPRGPHTHTADVCVPRCAACRRRNRILASSAIVGYGALVLAGAFLAAGLAVTELGLSGSNARYMRVVSIAAVLFIGVIVSQILVPLGKWCFFRKDPQVVWWRDMGWGFVDSRQQSG